MTAPDFPDPLARVSTTAVHVRWLVLDSIRPELRDMLIPLLDDAERARAARFHFEHDRQAYIAAHAMVRTLLSAQAPRPPKDWRFGANDHGKPHAVLTTGVPPLSFNLSHTRGLVAVALTLVHDVGIDVEAVDPSRLGLDLAERTFAPAEIALVRATPAASQAEALFAIWTLKEACIKAMGQGLSVPLDSFAVSLDPLAVHFSASLGENAGEWLLRRMAPTSTHVAALALRHPDPAAVSVKAAPIEVAALVALAQQFG